MLGLIWTTLCNTLMVFREGFGKKVDLGKKACAILDQMLLYVISAMTDLVSGQAEEILIYLGILQFIIV